MKSDFASAEWAAGMAADPVGLRRKLIPVRIEACAPEGLLKGIGYIETCSTHVVLPRTVRGHRAIGWRAQEWICSSAAMATRADVHRVP